MKLNLPLEEFLVEKIYKEVFFIIILNPKCACFLLNYCWQYFSFSWIRTSYRRKKQAHGLVLTLHSLVNDSSITKKQLMIMPTIDLSQLNVPALIQSVRKPSPYTPGLFGVAPRVCRELASISMMVLRSNTGGAWAGLQVVETDSLASRKRCHRSTIYISVALRYSSTKSRLKSDKMRESWRKYSLPRNKLGKVFGDGSRGSWRENREAESQGGWSAGWSL